MKRLICFLGLVLIACASRLIAYEQQDLLKSSDINRIMQQILEHHVNKKEMTTKILQNAVTTYIDQFDPHRIYLLENEVTPFTHLPLSELNALVNQYKHNDFSIFKKLNQVIQVSIERSRRIRHEIEIHPEVFSKDLEKDSKLMFKENQNFARTPAELKERLSRHLEAYLIAQRHRYGGKILEQKQAQEESIKAYENHLRDFEDNYLFQDEKGKPLSLAEQENLFTIHVLKALASSLDAHTTFYQASEAYDMRVRLQKEFHGVGLVLKDTSNGVMVSNLLPGGPAAKSGLIQIGDILLEVDGKRVLDNPFEKVMEMLHGEKTPDITLVFRRKIGDGQSDKIYTVKLKREEIILNNDRVDVDSKPFGNGMIGIITLHSFYQGDGVSSEKDVRDAIQKLENKGNLRGLILDLRENSGGFLSQAVKVAGLFITNGIIVISKYASGEEKFYRDVDGKAAYEGPIVVLTSKATASAAEIVAQALQDYGVAVVVGDEHTYGKGTIQSQTVTDNKGSSYFKVTVGKYYTVSGKTPQKTGVKADVVVPGHWSHELIGEEYVDSTVEPDRIPPAYEDPLTDISPDVKPWYLKYYIPKLQYPKTVWQHMVPTLKKNSQYRIDHNKDYQFYLKGQATDEDIADEEEWIVPSKKSRNYGEDDLQLQEAVNIVKDMVLLHGLEPHSAQSTR